MENFNKNILLLKDKLPHGSLKEIAKISNTTIFTVSRVFNGKSNNLKVLKATREYIKTLQDGNKEVASYLEQVNSVS